MKADNGLLAVLGRRGTGLEEWPFCVEINVIPFQCGKLASSESGEHSGQVEGSSRAGYGQKPLKFYAADKARLIERLPEGNRRAALDALSEICPKSGSIVNRVRAWQQLSIDLAQRFAAQVIQPSTARMRIAPPQKRLSQSI